MVMKQELKKLTTHLYQDSKQEQATKMLKLMDFIKSNKDWVTQYLVEEKPSSLSSHFEIYDAMIQDPERWKTLLISEFKRLSALVSARHLREKDVRGLTFNPFSLLKRLSSVISNKNMLDDDGLTSTLDAFSLLARQSFSWQQDFENLLMQNLKNGNESLTIATLPVTGDVLWHLEPVTSLRGEVEKLEATSNSKAIVLAAKQALEDN
jgi:hypothetical protein